MTPAGTSTSLTSRINGMTNTHTHTHMHFLLAIADLTHPLQKSRSSLRVIGCLLPMHVQHSYTFVHQYPLGAEHCLILASSPPLYGKVPRQILKQTNTLDSGKQSMEVYLHVQRECTAESYAQHSMFEIVHYGRVIAKETKLFG